jgi:hypothetical protein
MMTTETTKIGVGSYVLQANDFLLQMSRHGPRFPPTSSYRGKKSRLSKAHYELADLSSLLNCFRKRKMSDLHTDARKSLHLYLKFQRTILRDFSTLSTMSVHETLALLSSYQRGIKIGACTSLQLLSSRLNRKDFVWPKVELGDAMWLKGELIRSCSVSTSSEVPDESTLIIQFTPTQICNGLEWKRDAIMLPERRLADRFFRNPAQPLQTLVKNSLHVLDDCHVSVSRICAVNVKMRRKPDLLGSAAARLHVESLDREACSLLSTHIGSSAKGTSEKADEDVVRQAMLVSSMARHADATLDHLLHLVSRAIAPCCYCSGSSACILYGARYLTTWIPCCKLESRGRGWLGRSARRVGTRLSPRLPPALQSFAGTMCYMPCRCRHVVLSQ